jgi:hypothetical protein
MENLIILFVNNQEMLEVVVIHTVSQVSQVLVPIQTSYPFIPLSVGCAIGIAGSTLIKQTKVKND